MTVGGVEPLDLYDEGLRAGVLRVMTDDETTYTLSVEQWRLPRHGDDSVVTRCTGPTLDVGCGPGRLAYAVAATGVPALGIDISARAIHEARRRGVAALRRDFFGPVPAVGRWSHLLLIDGNIGIAGNPVALLTRCRVALAHSGSVVVELGAPGLGLHRMMLRLVRGNESSEPFPWVRVGVDVIDLLAESAGLIATDTWSSHGRWFAELRHERSRQEQDPPDVEVALDPMTLGRALRG